MAVPFGGRPKQPAIEIMRQLYAERFHYILHFQAAWRRRGGDGCRHAPHPAHDDAQHLGGCHPGITFCRRNRLAPGLFDGMHDPGTLPAWCDSNAFAQYLKTFEGRGFYGALNWYRNFERNWQRTEALAERQIEQPALFLLGDLDPVGTLEAYTLKQMPKRIVAARTACAQRLRALDSERAGRAGQSSCYWIFLQSPLRLSPAAPKKTPRLQALQRGVLLSHRR